MAATPNNFQNTWQGLALVCLAGLVYLVDPESIEKLADFSIHLHPDLQHINGPPPIWDELFKFFFFFFLFSWYINCWTQKKKLHQPLQTTKINLVLFYLVGFVQFICYEGLGKDLNCSYYSGGWDLLQS